MFRSRTTPIEEKILIAYSTDWSQVMLLTGWLSTYVIVRSVFDYCTSYWVILHVLELLM
jgi:hypothetical protein